MKYLLILSALLFSACTSIQQNKPKIPFPSQTISTIEIRKLRGGDFSYKAYAEIQGDKCTIYLRNYPECLAHEVRHCYEGNWHKGRKSTEYC